VLPALATDSDVQPGSFIHYLPIFMISYVYAYKNGPSPYLTPPPSSAGETTVLPAFAMDSDVQPGSFIHYSPIYMI